MEFADTTLGISEQYLLFATRLGWLATEFTSHFMVVEFTTTCAIIAYHHLSCEFELHSWRGVLDKTLCDKVCQ
jgi:hypothetical protein